MQVGSIALQRFTNCPPKQVNSLLFCCHLIGWITDRPAGSVRYARWCKQSDTSRRPVEEMCNPWAAVRMTGTVFSWPICGCYRAVSCCTPCGRRAPLPWRLPSADSHPEERKGASWVKYSNLMNKHVNLLWSTSVNKWMLEDNSLKPTASVGACG